MKQLYEYIAIWVVNGGFQIATVFVNAYTKTQAKNIIKEKLGNKDGFYLNIDCYVYAYTRKDIPDNNILVVYFDTYRVLHRDII